MIDNVEEMLGVCVSRVSSSPSFPLLFLSDKVKGQLTRCVLLAPLSSVRMLYLCYFGAVISVKVYTLLGLSEMCSEWNLPKF